MFTGIVKGCARILTMERRSGLVTLELAFPAGFDEGLEIGASVAVDGVCLTVTTLSPGQARFDVMQESLARTTLAEFDAGDEVNVERAARDGAEIGGHPLSGHVDGTAVITAIDTPENNVRMIFSVGAELTPYIFSKGYIAINGTSLTVSNVDRKAGTFEVWLIPETLRMTSFAHKKPGDRVNIEIERATQVTVDTIRSYLDTALAPLLSRLDAQALIDSVQLQLPPPSANDPSSRQ